MKKLCVATTGSVVAVLLLTFAPDIGAYDRYDDGCDTCHGGFKSSTSPKGSIFPSGDKHEMHKASSSMNTECDLCHTDGDGRDPFIGSSNGTANNAGLGCMGCHGRSEDAGNDGISAGLGAGLRQHHNNTGITGCAICHTDSNPINYEPVGEHIKPPYYGTVDTNADMACNSDPVSNANENWTIGDFLGLDNDGDVMWDKISDSDCNPAPSPIAAAVVNLGDLNANGSSDIAVSISAATFQFQVRDGATDALIAVLDFGPDMAIDVAVLPDLNSSGAPEVALLQRQASGQVRVQIRDSLATTVTKNLFYGMQYEPISMRAVPDYNNSGLPEIAVLGSQAADDAVRVQVQDAATGTFLDNVFLGTQSIAWDLLALVDTSGNSIPELSILGVLKGSNQVRSQTWDAETAAFQSNVWFGKTYQPHSTITMPDINVNGSDEIVAIGVDPATQNIRVQVRDSDTTATLFNIWLGAVNEAVDVALINDINSDGVADLAVLLKTPAGVGRVRVQSGSNGAFIRNLFYSVVDEPVGLAVMPDYNGGGFDELAVLGESAGVRHVQILDTATGTQVNRIDFP